MRKTNYKYFFYLSSIMLFALACTAVGTPNYSEEDGASLIAATKSPKPAPLITREPYIWMPPYDSFTTFGSLPFDTYFESSNEEVAESRDNPEEMLKFLNRVGRINSNGYNWYTDNCWLTNDVFEISRGRITVIWFKTAEGAQEAFKFYENEDRNDPDNSSVESINYGENARIVSWYSDDDCFDKISYRELSWLRYNVIANVRMGSHGKLSNDELDNYIMEVANQLDEEIMKEAKAFPAPDVQESQSSDTTSNDPLSLLSINLSCGSSQGTSDGFWFDLSGDIRNEGLRPIQADILLITYEDNEVFSQTPYTAIIEPGVEVPISFSGIFIPDPYRFVPPDDPFTEEYEPDVWIEMNPIPEYSCDIKMEAQWKD